jgi:hypothetical protein
MDDTPQVLAVHAERLLELAELLRRSPRSPSDHEAQALHKAMLKLSDGMIEARRVIEAIRKLEPAQAGEPKARVHATTAGRA